MELSPRRHYQTHFSQQRQVTFVRPYADIKFQYAGISSVIASCLFAQSTMVTSSVMSPVYQTTSKTQVFMPLLSEMRYDRISISVTSVGQKSLTHTSVIRAEISMDFILEGWSKTPRIFPRMLHALTFRRQGQGKHFRCQVLCLCIRFFFFNFPLLCLPCFCSHIICLWQRQ